MDRVKEDGRPRDHITNFNLRFLNALAAKHQAKTRGYRARQRPPGVGRSPVKRSLPHSIKIEPGLLAGEQGTAPGHLARPDRSSAPPPSKRGKTSPDAHSSHAGTSASPDAKQAKEPTALEKKQARKAEKKARKAQKKHDKAQRAAAKATLQHRADSTPEVDGPDSTPDVKPDASATLEDAPLSERIAKTTTPLPASVPAASLQIPLEVTALPGAEVSAASDAMPPSSFSLSATSAGSIEYTSNFQTPEAATSMSARAVDAATKANVTDLHSSFYVKGAEDTTSQNLPGIDPEILQQLANGTLVIDSVTQAQLAKHRKSSSTLRDQLQLGSSPSCEEMKGALAQLTARIKSLPTPTQRGLYRPSGPITDAEVEDKVDFAAQTTLNAILLQQPGEPYICPFCCTTAADRLACQKKSGGRISMTQNGPNAGAITEASHWCQESKDAPHQLFLTLAAAVPISTAPADPELATKATTSALATKKRLAAIKLLYAPSRAESPDLSESSHAASASAIVTLEAAAAPTSGDAITAIATHSDAAPAPSASSSGYNLRRTNSA